MQRNGVGVPEVMSFVSTWPHFVTCSSPNDKGVIAQSASVQLVNISNRHSAFTSNWVSQSTAINHQRIKQINELPNRLGRYLMHSFAYWLQAALLTNNMHSVRLYAMEDS